MSKPILCLDFDGVIHAYVSGWVAADVIPDGPVPGAMDFIRRAIKDFRVMIYSSRSGQPGGIIAMKQWLHEHCDGARWFDEIEWPASKPPAFLSIDDRVLTFNGDWESYRVRELLAFKPWNKRGV